MLNQKVFGEKLRNHRKKLGMTQEEVAEKVGVFARQTETVILKFYNQDITGWKESYE